MSYTKTNDYYRVKKQINKIIIDLKDKTLERLYVRYKEKLSLLKECIKMKTSSIDEVKKALNDQTTNNVSFNTLFNKYISSIKKNYDIKTIDKFKALYKNHLMPILATYNPKSLSNTDLRRIRDILKENTETSNIAYRSSRLLKNFLIYMLENEAIAYNIVPSNILIKKDKSIRSDDIEMKYITFDQFTSIVRRERLVSTKRTLKILTYIKFLYYTGLRINEARAIKLSDFKIDYDKRTDKKRCYINVERQLDDNRQTVIEHLKNGTKPRKVYVEPEVFWSLLSYFDEKDGKDYFIFDDDKDGHVLNRSSISNQIKWLIKYLKDRKLIDETIPDNLSPHSMRYSNTYYLYKVLNLSAEESALIQGHSVQVMLDTYLRVDNTSISDTFGF